MMLKRSIFSFTNEPLLPPSSPKSQKENFEKCFYRYLCVDVLYTKNSKKLRCSHIVKYHSSLCRLANLIHRHVSCTACVFTFI